MNMALVISEREYKDLRIGAMREQHSLFEMRRETQSHTELIRDAAPMKKPDEEFIVLLRRAFGHHELKSFSRIVRKDVDIQQQDHVSKWFHQEYFSNVIIRRGTARDNAILSREEFIERIAEKAVATPEFTSQPNNVQFLVGDIGDGKTTFLCNLLYTQWLTFLSRKTLPIRFNVDVLTDHTVPPCARLLNIFLDTTLAWMRNNDICPQADSDFLRLSSRLTEPENPDHVALVLSNLIRLIKKRLGRNLLFIIDNIDFLYHIGDRGAFSKAPTIQQVSAYEAIIDIFRLFSRDDQILANLGINILYCIRADTLEYIKSKRLEVPLPDLTNRTACLTPVGTDAEQTLEIINQRFTLVRDLVESITEPKKRMQFKSQIDQLQASYGYRSERGDHPFRDLRRLARHGLRDIIDHFSHYAWIERDDGSSGLNLRFTGQYSPSILTYVLGGRRRYCQFNGHIPNLYLVNATAPANEYGVPDEFKREHFVTFWLKRMILEYLLAKAEQYVNADELVKVFCGRNRRGYPEGLVRYMAGGLSQVPESECVKVDISAQGGAGQHFYIRKITVTERGRFLAQDFADSFTYLQLMVDDWRLRLPREMRSDFAYTEPDYRYLVEDMSTYGERVKKVLQNKARQSIVFALFLEEYARVEQQLWPRVYERLRQERVSPPRKGQIVNRVIRDLDRITQHLNLRVQVFDVYSVQSSIDAKRRRIAKIVDHCAASQLRLNQTAYGG
jgi:hypothetical protein